MSQIKTTLLFLTVLIIMVSCEQRGAKFGETDMKLNSKISSSETNARLFTLEYRAVSGPQLGENIYEEQRILRLDRKDNTAFLEKHRSASDKAGAPIGTFRARLSNELFEQVFELVYKVGLANIPSPTQGEMATSVMTLTFEHGQTKMKKVFNDADTSLLERLGPLLQKLRQITAELEKNPESAVKIEAKHVRGGGDGQFQITVTNIGSQTICIADPRTFGHDDPDRWAGVRIAELPEERPGYTSPPLKWSNLMLPLQGTRGMRAVLKPGETFTALTENWFAPRKNVRYIIQGVFSDYKGPGDVNDGYPIRGAAFSNAIELIPK